MVANRHNSRGADIAPVDVQTVRRVAGELNRRERKVCRQVLAAVGGERSGEVRAVAALDKDPGSRCPGHRARAKPTQPKRDALATSESSRAGAADTPLLLQLQLLLLGSVTEVSLRAAEAAVSEMNSSTALVSGRRALVADGRDGAEQQTRRLRMDSRRSGWTAGYPRYPRCSACG
eukprot:COSAG01_NODE_9889_length_2311_cov_1.304250_2_plen_176_part_00